MAHLRRLVAPLAALLALVVAGEATDVVSCRDADCGARSLFAGDGLSDDGSGPAESVACGCHAQFVASAAGADLPDDHERRPVEGLRPDDVVLGQETLPD